jgi:hypothetical protein
LHRTGRSKRKDGNQLQDVRKDTLLMRGKGAGGEEKGSPTTDFPRRPILGGGAAGREMSLFSNSPRHRSRPAKGARLAGRATLCMAVGHETHWALVEAEHWMRFESCRGYPIRPMEDSLGTVPPPRHLTPAVRDFYGAGVLSTSALAGGRETAGVTMSVLTSSLKSADEA